MATRVGRGKIQLAAFDSLFSKTPHKCKKLADIFYTSRVIGNFVPNFVTMATGVGGQKCGGEKKSQILPPLLI